MNLGSILRAFDTVAAVRDAARRLKAPAPSEPSPGTTLTPADPLHSPIEARLTGVVVAALKEAFDRDRARLDLERAQLDEQRRRAEAALRAELRRQAVDREVGRLRLIAGTALVGWIATVAFVMTRLASMSKGARAASAVGWLLLLAALALAFIGQGRIDDGAGGLAPATGDRRAGDAALGLLIAGLACAGMALLF
jgi:hypothetical protein